MPPKARRATTARRSKPNSALEKSAGAVIFHRGKTLAYLLIFSTYWEFPKGLIDPDESERAAAEREVREETGLSVALLPDFREEINYFYRRKTGLLVKKQVVYFLGEARTRDVHLSWEHHDAQWLPFDEALALLKFANARTTLQQAHAFLEDASKT